MNEYKIKAKYLQYVLSKSCYPYEDISKDKTMDYETYKNKLEGVK